MNNIRICTYHDKQVPLIWTFAFDGSEYWCPYCGANYGMLGAGEMVPSTMGLKRSLITWQDKTKEFIAAKSTLASHKTEWKGEMIRPEDLPEEEKLRIEKVIDAWEYESEKVEL